MNKFLKPGFLIPLLSCLAFFIYWLVRYYISHDLVWDELVSLKNFVLVDLITTVTHYPDVNNHLFFNLLNNLYCKLIQVDNIYEAMDAVVLIRIYPLLISLFSIFFVYKTAAKFYNANAGFMAVIILITTIPFLNFTMQLRGYTMGMAFMIMAIYFLWSFERNKSWLYAVMIVFSVFGLLYSIPSNIYFVLSISIIYFIKWVTTGRNLSKSMESKSFVESWIKQNNFYIMIFIGLGLTLAFFAYLPILEDLLNERHLQQLKGQSFYSHTLKNIIPFVLHYILSYRFLLLIPFIVSITVISRNIRKKEWKEEDQQFLFLLSIVILSFIISLVRGDKPHQRTFTPLTVVIAVLLGGSTYQYFRNLQWFKERGLLSFSIVFVYSLASFLFCQSLIQSKLHKSIISGKKVYNMFYNFYQSEEYGMYHLDPLIEEASQTGYPIIMAKEIDRVAEGAYLLKNELNYFSTVWAKPSQTNNEAGFEYQVLLEISQGRGKDAGYKRISFPPSISNEEGMFIPLFSFLYQKKVIDQTNPKCYVLTFSPRWFERVMKNSLPNLKYTRLNRKQSYHNLYLISGK